MHRKVAAALVAALALGVASCGTSEVRITAGQFAPTLTSICAKARAQVQAVANRGRHASGDPRARLFAALSVGERYVVNRLDGITPPPAMRHEFDVLKREVRARLRLFERLQAAGSAGVQQAIAANAREQHKTFERIDAISHRYQITGCA